MGRDEKKIYPFSTTTNAYDDANNEYDYATNDEYDEDDEDELDKKSTSTTAAMTTMTTTTEADSVNYDQIEAGDSDWDVNNDETEATFDIQIDNQNQQAFINENDLRPLIPAKGIRQNFFVTFLPYIIGCLFIVCIMIGFIIFRLIKRHRSYKNQYEKNYLFTEVDSYTPEEKALYALQSSGYENPTYKFFESQSAKC